METIKILSETNEDIYNNTYKPHLCSALLPSLVFLTYIRFTNGLKGEMFLAEDKKGEKKWEETGFCVHCLERSPRLPQAKQALYLLGCILNSKTCVS